MPRLSLVLLEGPPEASGEAHGFPDLEQAVIDRQSELDQRTCEPDERLAQASGTSNDTLRPGGSPDPIAAELDFLLPF